MAPSSMSLSPVHRFLHTDPELLFLSHVLSDPWTSSLCSPFSSLLARVIVRNSLSHLLTCGKSSTMVYRKLGAPLSPIVLLQSPAAQLLTLSILPLFTPNPNSISVQDLPGIFVSGSRPFTPALGAADSGPIPTLSLSPCLHLCFPPPSPYTPPTLPPCRSQLVKLLIHTAQHQHLTRPCSL